METYEGPASEKYPGWKDLAGLTVATIAIAAIIFGLGFLVGQDHPRPGTTLTSEAAKKLNQYEELSGEAPKPRMKPSQPGNFIQLVRRNGVPQQVADGKSKAVLVVLSFPDPPGSKQFSRGIEGAFNDLGEFQYIMPDRWTKLDTCSVKRVFDESVGTQFSTFEVNPNKK